MTEKQRETYAISMARGHTVSQSNNLVRKIRNQLTEHEQRIIWYWISKIKPSDTKLEWIAFPIGAFCRECGIGGSGKDYQNVKSVVKSIADKSSWVEFIDGKIRLVRWLDEAEIDPNTGVISILFCKHLEKDLINLRKHATAFELIYTLAMRSRYSMRLYELMKSYEYKGGVKYKVEELKKLLTAEYDEKTKSMAVKKYNRYPDFKRKVLDVAVREINDITDLTVSYEPILDGQKTSEISFRISKKTEMGERLEVIRKIHAHLKDNETPQFIQLGLQEQPSWKYEAIDVCEESGDLVNNMNN